MGKKGLVNVLYHSCSRDTQFLGVVDCNKGLYIGENDVDIKLKQQVLSFLCLFFPLPVSKLDSQGRSPDPFSRPNIRS